METYKGFVRSPADAIILFEACRRGLLPRVQRRLSDKERKLIQPGSVFVWDEREAGMRRWTDGKSWSASRVSGSFLTYKEMEGKRGGNGVQSGQAPKKPVPKASDCAPEGESDTSGPDGYRYKPDGLMKQSFSITTSDDRHLHLISYFQRQQDENPKLKPPSEDPTLRHIRPPRNLYPESTVVEPAAMPMVSQGPLPGSPFAATPQHHQPPVASPYSARPAATPTYSAHTPPWPPTPHATPPYSAQYGYYSPQGPPPSASLPTTIAPPGALLPVSLPLGTPNSAPQTSHPPGPDSKPHVLPHSAHSPAHYGHVGFPQPNHPPHSGSMVSGSHHYDSHPLTSGSALPLPPGHPFTIGNGPPPTTMPLAHGQPCPAPQLQYPVHPSARAVARETPPQQAQAIDQHDSVPIDPQLRGMGPQLPAINQVALQSSQGGRSASPRPLEHAQPEPLRILQPSNLVSLATSSTPRTIPSVNALLNDSPMQSASSMKHEPKLSRNNSLSPQRDTRLAASGADRTALDKLNSHISIA